MIAALFADIADARSFLLLSLILELAFILVAILLCRFYYLERRHNRSGRAITMEDAWVFWMEGKLSNEDRRLVELVQRSFAGDAVRRIRKELLEIEHQAQAAENSVTTLRAAIMEAVDTSLLNKEILELDDKTRRSIQTKLGDLYTDEIFYWQSLAKDLVCRILRWYSYRKYGDGRAGSDWFASYVKMASTRSRRLVERLQDWDVGKGGIARLDLLSAGLPGEQTLNDLRAELLGERPRGSIKSNETIEADKHWSW